MAVHVRWPLLPYAAHRRALASVCSRHLEHYLLVRCCCLVYACYSFFLRRGPACRCGFLAVFPSFSSCVMDSCPFFFSPPCALPDGAVEFASRLSFRLAAFST